MSQHSRRPHLARGTSAATLATFAALCGHVAAGGDMPGPLGIVVPWSLSLMVSVLLAGRRLSVTRLSLSVIASQTLFHTLFVLGTPTGAGSGQIAAPGHQHGSAAMQMPAQMPAPLSLPTDATMALIHADTTMWVSHFVSALITIAFLVRGEQALVKLRELTEWLVSWVKHSLTDPPTATHLATPPRTLSARAKGWSVLAQLQASTINRRGPPHAAHLTH